jgi:hypothetical protein
MEAEDLNGIIRFNENIIEQPDCVALIRQANYTD